MNLKKVILVFIIITLISIFVINTHFTLENRITLTGAAAGMTDLPPPPGMPSFEQPTRSDDTLQAELNSINIKLTQLDSMTDKMSTLESDMIDVKREVESMDGKITDIPGYAEKRSSALGTFVDIILILAIAGLIGYIIFTKKKQEAQTIQAIIDYAKQYTNQGYTKEQLVPVLRQAGYSQIEIKKALKEIKR